MSFQIRHASSDGVPALAKLHVQTFNETHRGGRSGGPSYELRERQWREAFTVTDGSWFCFVVEDDDGELVAFAKGTPHDGGVPGFAGELNKIYALQRVHRQGVGRLLLCNVAREFLSRGVASMRFQGSHESVQWFYEAFGAERLYSDSGRSPAPGAHGWRDLHVLVPRCSGA